MKTFRVSVFGRKLGVPGMFTQLPWQEIHDVENEHEAIKRANSNLKDTHEYLDYVRCEPIKFPIIIPFMSMPDTAFAVGVM